MWPWIQNNIPIILIALSFGASGLTWLFKKLKEANEKKQADQFRQKARLEALRTGRIDGRQQEPQTSGPRVAPVAQAETPRQRLEDLARRRQQGQQERTATQRTELEEQLRRRREAIDAQRQRQQQQRQPAPGQRSAQKPAQRPTQQPTQRPQQRTAVKPSPQPRRTGERRPVSPLPTMQPAQETVIADVISAKRAEEATPVEAPLPVGGLGHRSAPITARGFDVRQALIMREILDRPIGLREPRDPGW